MVLARTPADLAAALRNEAGQLPAAAKAAAGTLEDYAARMLQPSEAVAAVKEFAAFADHFKGLQDLVVPEVSAERWRRVVWRLRDASRSVLRCEGLDESFVGRLLRFVGTRGKGHVV